MEKVMPRGHDKTILIAVLTPRLGSLRRFEEKGASMSDHYEAEVNKGNINMNALQRRLNYRRLGHRSQVVSAS